MDSRRRLIDKSNEWIERRTKVSNIKENMQRFK